MCCWLELLFIFFFVVGGREKDLCFKLNVFVFYVGVEVGDRVVGIFYVQVVVQVEVLFFQWVGDLQCVVMFGDNFVRQYVGVEEWINVVDGEYFVVMVGMEDCYLLLIEQGVDVGGWQDVVDVVDIYLLVYVFFFIRVIGICLYGVVGWCWLCFGII